METGPPVDGMDDWFDNDIFRNVDLDASEISHLAAILDGEDAYFSDHEENEQARIAAAQGLYDFAQQHPDDVAVFARTLGEQLAAPTRTVRRSIAATVTHALAVPAPFIEHTSEFASHLDSDDPVVRNTAASVLGRIATHSPGAVSAVDDLTSLIDDPAARATATDALARIGNDQPDAITTAAQPVIRQFRDLPAAGPDADDWLFRVSALEVIATIASVDPDAIDDVSDALRRAMRCDQWTVRRQAADTISVLIAKRPDTFTALEPDLRASLSDEDSHVCRSAARSYLRIAFNAPTAVGDPAAVVERLRTLDAESNDLPSDVLERALGILDPAKTEWRSSEYQLRHKFAEDIMIAPLRESGDSSGNPAGSPQAVELETDRSVLVLGETGSGKTEAIKILTHQMQTGPDEAFVVFDYKEDYQEFFADENVVRLSSTDSDVIWNVFHEIRRSEDCDEIAQTVFSGADVDKDYFTNAAMQVFADVLRLLRRRLGSAGGVPTNTYLVQFLDGTNAETLRNGFEEENLSSQKHLPGGVEATSNIISILQERVKAVFRDDFAKRGEFSIREYMDDPDGRILILDYPIKQSSSVEPIFRLFVDWSIRFGLDDNRGSYYLLDEFAALPRFDMLERLVNAGRAYNCYGILGVHSVSQLRERYGKAETHSLLSGLAQEIHLRVGDQASIDYCRQRIGRTQRIRGNGPTERVTEEYPIAEDTIQNLASGRGIVHTIEGWQRGRLHMLDEVKDELLPTDTQVRQHSETNDTGEKNENRENGFRR
jgi:energy-coupling factor transporter ATP-binding protein EcfA2